MPTVSVIIPTFNREKYLGEAIQSVLNQTYRDFELIIIDDGSTDATPSVVKSFKSARIHFVRQSNRGRSNARNHALRLARGKYIAFLDSDDLYLPDKIARQVAFLESHQEFGMVYTSAICIDESGALLDSTYEAVAGGWIYNKIAFFKPVTITLPTVMARRELFDKAGGFDEAMQRFEDTDMWRRISRFCQIGAMRESTCKLRTHRDNMLSSQDPGSMIEAINYYVEKIFREDTGEPLGMLHRGAGQLYLSYSEAFFSKREWWHHGMGLLQKAARHWPLNPRLPYVACRYAILRDFPKRLLAGSS